MMSRSKRILFLTPYPKDTAGSQRFRFEQYLSLLSDAGFEYQSQSFIDESTWSVLYKKGHAVQKIWGILSGFLRRFWMLKNLYQYDFVFVHREATPLGLPMIEWLISKVWRKKLIYDFDDAIWLSNTSAENRLANWFKFSTKVKHIIGWSYKVSAGNRYLVDFASGFNSNVICNPTTIDTEKRHLPQGNRNDLITIGWTGTHSTLKYLEGLREPLEYLAGQYKFNFIIIADQTPELPYPNQEFIPWDKASEIDDLDRIDIGVMPLEDDKWSKGKCGFKALQFMALEKPVLVSPVGVNQEIVEPDIHGYHCTTSEDWINKLKLLIEDKGLRQRLGKKGREKVQEKYALASNKQNFLSLFESA